MENKALKEGWKYGFLEDAVKKGSSNISLNKIKNDDGEYPVFGAKGFAKNISFYHQDKEYLAIIKDGAGIGRVSKYPEKSSVVATMQYLIPQDGFDIDFIRYFLNGIDFEKHRNGSTIPHIYFKDYKKERFPILPLAEQKQIVAVLDKAFGLIDKAQANIQKNIQNAKELFQAKLNEVFSQKGDGWEEKSLGEVCETGAGGTPLKSHKEYYKNGNIPWIRSGEVNNRNITDSEIKITDEGLNNSSAKLFPPETVVIAMYGATAGQVGILKFECATNQAVCGIYPNKNFKPEYLYYFFLNYKDRLISQAVGNAQPNISQAKIKNTFIPIPPITEQKQIVKQLNQLKTETAKIESHYQKKLLNLEALKKGFLERAFGGQLSAPMINKK